MKKTIAHTDPLIFNCGNTNIYLNDGESDILVFDAENIETAYFKNGQCNIVLKRVGKYKQALMKAEVSAESQEAQEVLNRINGGYGF